MSQRARVLAWGLTLLGASLIVATLVFMLLDPGGVAGSPGLLDASFSAIPVAFLTVGVLLATRRSGNSVGWLCLTIGLLWSLEGAGYEGARWAGNSGRLETAAWVGLLGSLWLPAMGLTGTHLTLRLPSGSLLSPRWRWWSRLCTPVIIFATALVATDPGRVADVPGTHSAIASEGLQAVSPLFVLFPVSILGAIASLVLRYRRAAGLERLQIRWIALGGLFFLAAVLTSVLPTLLGLVSKSSAPAAVEAVSYVAFTAIPVAIGIAVLRYRLYDIDVVINRALVYSALTATLAGVYLGSVLVLQLALSAVTEGSGLAVAASTLAVAAVFRPARGRIQTTVDRRFYRRKYDAAQTLERFGAHLRDEVDLTTLKFTLSAVVSEALQPAHVSLWLRDEPEGLRSAPAQGGRGTA